MSDEYLISDKKGSLINKRGALKGVLKYCQILKKKKEQDDTLFKKTRTRTTTRTTRWILRQKKMEHRNA